MNFTLLSNCWAFVRRLIVLLLVAELHSEAFSQGTNLPSTQATVLEAEGTVQTARARTADWRAARTNESLAPLDRLRTRERSRAALRLRDRSVFRIGELSELTVEVPEDSQSSTAVNMLRGVLMFFHRGNPRDVQFRTGTVSAAIRGTEFHVEVADNGRTVLTLFDGEVELSNPQGTLRLVSGEQASVDPGQPPVKTAVIVTRNELIQWCLYYPGVLDPAELNLTPAEAAALRPSLAAYRSGDLLQALALMPAGFQPSSDSTRVYLAAVLLSVGKVDAATTLLDAIPPDASENSDQPPAPRLAGALRRLVLVVKNSPDLAKLKPAPREPNCATLRLAESYEHQASANLAAALDAARDATKISPTFAFAWARVAELEFSFGRRREAQAALNRSLELAPRNAQAVALRGFLLAAEDRISAAFAAFDEAITLDGALGNAWLGRGLCRIRRGELNAGREDFQVAALMEPQRALLRSYLGKAWNELGDQRRAADELRLAKENDPRDPTAYLYEALLLQEDNRINEAVTALEHSQELNDNRRVYRSRLLLDQDAAVRGANLATIYRDAGMTDWSAREAGKAVNADYANYSAHLFLANSYNEFRDPTGVNLRYETPWLSEYLVANLLAPAGAGILSQSLSQHEYSKLFARDRIGFASATDYLSRGAWTQSAVQHGSVGSTSYALEGAYLTDNGEHRNSEVEQWGLSLQFKQQLGAADGIYFQATSAETRGGDLNQYSNPRFANPTLRFRDEAEPLLLAGYHHEWSPGSRTLVLASRLEGGLRVTDAFGQSRNYAQSNEVVLQIFPQDYDQRYRSTLEIYGGELQHIWQTEKHALVLGMRAQAGEFKTRNRHIPVDEDAPLFWGTFAGETNIQQQFETPFERFTLYAYDGWRVTDSLQLVGGVAWDTMRFPRNHRYAPIDDETDRADGVLPKAGLIWQVARSATVRFAYTRSLGGASFDQSFRLEPTQVAGFNQAFRSVIPENLVGANAGADFDVYNLAWDQRIGQRTYVGLTLERLESSFNRRVGGYGLTNFGIPAIGGLREALDYDETSILAVLDQLLGDSWVVGARYHWSTARLVSEWLDGASNVDVGFDFYSGDPISVSRRGSREGDLHELQLRLLFHHPSGLFAGTDGVWRRQDAEDRDVDLERADFWQWNATLGWRSSRRRVEASVGLLNILGDWDGLHAINLHATPLRERNLAARLRLAF